MQGYFPSQCFAYLSFLNTCSFCRGSLLLCARIVTTSTCGSDKQGCKPSLGCSRVHSWWKGGWEEEGRCLWVLPVVLDLLLLPHCSGSQLCPWRTWMCFFPSYGTAKKKKGSRTEVELSELSKDNLTVAWAFIREQVNMESKPKSLRQGSDKEEQDSLP